MHMDFDYYITLHIVSDIHM